MTFFIAESLAQKQDRDGELFVVGVGPMTPAQISAYTGIALKAQQAALDLLCTTQIDADGCLLDRKLDGGYRVRSFRATENPSKSSNAARQRRFRERTRNDSNVTCNVTRNVTERYESNVTRNVTDNVTDNVTAVTVPINSNYDDEVIISLDDEVNTKPRFASLRSAAIQYAVFPEEPAILRGLALIFVDRFANCRDLKKANRYVLPFSRTLQEMHSLGYTIAEAWKAFEDAWRLNGELPLHANQSHLAKGFLPRGGPRRKLAEPGYRSIASEDLA